MYYFAPNLVIFDHFLGAPSFPGKLGQGPPCCQDPLAIYPVFYSKRCLALPVPCRDRFAISICLLTAGRLQFCGAPNTVHKLSITQLEPDTTYWYSIVGTTEAGKVRTWMQGGVQPSLKIAFASCAKSYSSSDLFNEIAAGG